MLTYPMLETDDYFDYVIEDMYDNTEQDEEEVD